MHNDNGQFQYQVGICAFTYIQGGCSIAHTYFTYIVVYHTYRVCCFLMLTLQYNYQLRI